MTTISVTAEELGGLVQIIADLSEGSRPTAEFEHVLASLRRLIPFDACVFLHERGPAGQRSFVRYEFTGFRSGPGRRTFAGAAPSALKHYLRSLRRTGAIGSAFSWSRRKALAAAAGDTAGDTANSPAPAPRAHGIGAFAGDRQEQATGNASAILLQCPHDAVLDRHLAFVHCIIRPLHSALLRTWEAANDSAQADGRSASDVHALQSLHWTIVSPQVH